MRERTTTPSTSPRDWIRPPSFRSTAETRPRAQYLSSTCPESDLWPRLAAGLLHPAEAEPLAQHASTCNDCGTLLQQASLDFAPDTTFEEDAFVRQLKSSRSGWQRNLALRMAAQSAPQAKPEPLFQKVLTYPRARVSWFPGWMRGAAPVAAVLVIAISSWFWTANSRSLASANMLIAQAYSEHRSLQMRLPGTNYAALRQQRGSTSSRLDLPSSLLEAEAQVQRHLNRNPDNPEWLHADAKIQLLEGSDQAAIEALTKARIARPNDATIALDLATAYSERAASTGDTTSNATALQLLNEILSRDPRNPVALFDRALVLERTQSYPEAIADWRQYMQLDPNSGWSIEAQQHLDDSTRRLMGR